MCHGGPGPWSHLCKVEVVFLPKIRAALRTEVLKTVTLKYRDSEGYLGT